MSKIYITRKAKILIAAVAAAAVVLSMAITAVAANLWGIRELFDKTGYNLPAQAEEYIQQQSAETKDDDLSCRLVESLYDGKTLVLSFSVSCSEGYILIPTDSSAGDPASSAGINSSETLGEYAASQEKELLNVGIGFSDMQALDIISVMQHFEHISESEMMILVKADTERGTALKDGCCIVYVQGGSGKKPLELEFSVENTSDPDAEIFVPVDFDCIPGVQVGPATVIKTPLGIEVEFKEIVTDYEAFSRMEFVCEEISGLFGGSVKEDECYYMQWSGGQGTVGDTLTIHVYDVETGAFIGDIVFKKQ